MWEVGKSVSQTLCHTGARFQTRLRRFSLRRRGTISDRISTRVQKISTVTLLEVFTMAYTQQDFNVIAGRYGRSFLDPGRNAIGNRAAPCLAKSAVRVGCRSTSVR